MTKWILLAEDNEQDAELSLRALTPPQRPAEVIVAHDGAEALDCLYRRGDFRRIESSPALVLLDLKMPKIDGLEVLRRMKADSQLKKIPVVIFTSSRQESDLTRSYELGANAYVVKPLDFHEFMQALREVSTFWLFINQPPPDGPSQGHSTQLSSAA